MNFIMVMKDKKYVVNEIDHQLTDKEIIKSTRPGYVKTSYVLREAESIKFDFLDILAQHPRN